MTMATEMNERDNQWEVFGQSTTADLCLGNTNPKKVVHHRRCHHARTDYIWAREFTTLDELATALVVNQAWQWHRCCQLCCGDLDDAIYRALASMGGPVLARSWREG